jgi:hypothetical protein
LTCHYALPRIRELPIREANSKSNALAGFTPSRLVGILQQPERQQDKNKKESNKNGKNAGARGNYQNCSWSMMALQWLKIPRCFSASLLAARFGIQAACPLAWLRRRNWTERNYLTDTSFMQYAIPH